MRPIAALAVLVLAAGPAAADPAPKAKPTAARPVAKCKPTVVGRGLDRKVFCELDTPIILKESAPKPHVAIIAHDGRAVVGPTHSTDPFAGLSHQLR